MGWRDPFALDFDNLDNQNCADQKKSNYVIGPGRCCKDWGLPFRWPFRLNTESLNDISRSRGVLGGSSGAPACGTERAAPAPAGASRARRTAHAT